MIPVGNARQRQRQGIRRLRTIRLLPRPALLERPEANDMLAERGGGGIVALGQLRWLTGLMLIFFSCMAQAQSVETRAIRHQAVEQVIRTFGELTPRIEELSFQVPGRIETFFAKESSQVGAGELLAVLDTQDAQDALRRARSEFEVAERQLERMKTLHASGAIQASSLEDAQSEHDQRRIRLEQAQLQVDRCHLRAPSAGVILEQSTLSRTSVAAGQPIFTFLGAEEPWLIEVGLTDRNVLLLRPGVAARVRFAPWPNVTFDAAVTRISRVANPKDGLFTTEITLDPGEFELLPGMIAEVDVLPVSAQPHSIVPLDALLDVRNQVGTIYVLAEDRGSVRARSVTIHSIVRDSVAVHEDLRGYQEVVVRGHYGLDDGAAVTVVNPR